MILRIEWELCQFTVCLSKIKLIKMVPADRFFLTFSGLQSAIARLETLYQHPSRFLALLIALLLGYVPLLRSSSCIITLHTDKL